MNSLFDNRIVTFILSFFLAIVLFFYVRGEFSTRQSITVSLNYLKNTRLVPVGPRPESLQVDLRGPSALVSSLMKQEHRIDIDLSQEAPGIVVRGNFESVLRGELPREVIVLRIVPREIKFELDPFAKNTIPLEVSVVGAPKNGFEVGGIEMKPDKITIGGAERIVKNATIFKVGPIDLADAQADIKKELTLVSDDEDTWVLAPKSVKIVITIKEKIVQKTFEVPVTMRDSPLNSTFNPERIKLVVEGPFRVVESLTPSDFSAYVDGRNMRPGHYRQPVAVKSPESVKLVDNQPRYFAIRVWKGS